MVEHPKSKSTQPSFARRWVPLYRDNKKRGTRLHDPASWLPQAAGAGASSRHLGSIFFTISVCIFFLWKSFQNFVSHIAPFSGGAAEYQKKRPFKGQKRIRLENLLEYLETCLGMSAWQRKNVPGSTTSGQTISIWSGQMSPSATASCTTTLVWAYLVVWS